MTGELDARVAIVTGGASGIGAESARCLAAAGAQVVLADLQDQAGAAVAAAIGGAALFQHHDVRQPDSWQHLLQAVIARFGRLDILVNNAGIGGGRGSIEDTTLEQWQQVHAVNSEGVFLGCKTAVEGMKRLSAGKPQPAGSIINISSVAGLVGGAAGCAYTASKGAVRLTTKSVALHCAQQGWAIRCNSIHPGGIDTPIFAPLWQAVGEAEGRALIASRHPVGRIGQPREIAETVLFLASDRSGFMTGTELAVDGGLTAGLQRRTSHGAS